MLWYEFDDLSMQDMKKNKILYYDMVWHLSLLLVITCKFFAFFFNEDLLTHGSIKCCVCSYYWMNLLEKGWNVKHLVKTRDNLDPKY